MSSRKVYIAKEDQGGKVFIIYDNNEGLSCCCPALTTTLLVYQLSNGSHALTSHRQQSQSDHWSNANRHQYHLFRERFLFTLDVR
jgi:hypothetical protein